MGDLKKITLDLGITPLCRQSKTGERKSVVWLRRVRDSIRAAALCITLDASAGLAATWAQVLEGRWTGPDMTLTIDQGAIMANQNPAKPFDWHPFRIVTANGSMVVFDIGTDRYVGILKQDTLLVTRTGSTGSWQLLRDRSNPIHRPVIDHKR